MLFNINYENESGSAMYKYCSNNFTSRIQNIFDKNFNKSLLLLYITCFQEKKESVGGSSEHTKYFVCLEHKMIEFIKTEF